VARIFSFLGSEFYFFKRLSLPISYFLSGAMRSSRGLLIYFEKTKLNIAIFESVCGHITNNSDLNRPPTGGGHKNVETVVKYCFFFSAKFFAASAQQGASINLLKVGCSGRPTQST
jgi:hypothetical protein